MRVKVYVIKRVWEYETTLYLTDDNKWVKSCQFEDIHYFTKKKLAEEKLNELKGDDETMMVHVISLEMD